MPASISPDNPVASELSTAESYSAKYKWRWVLVVATLVGGIFFSLFVGKKIYDNEKQSWLNEAKQDAELVTTTFLYWLDGEMQPLRSLATLFFGSQSITESEFRAATEFMEFTETTVRHTSIAYFQQDTDGEFHYTFSTNQGDSNYSLTGPQRELLVSVLNMASLSPQAIVMSPVFLGQNHRLKVYYGTVADNGSIGGVLLTEVDLSRLFQSLQELHQPSGLHLRLAYRGLGDKRVKPDYILGSSSPHKQRVESKLLRAINSQAYWEFYWDILPGYKGGFDATLPLMATISGVLISFLICSVFAVITWQNIHVRRQVELRTSELRLAYDDLKNTQGQLVQSEKLASLGGLVAGLAHELNTPIGNCRMVATTLDQKATEFKQLVEGGKIQRSSVNQFCEDLAEGSTLIMHNSEKADELIRSFKQVAVDQTSERRRRFNLESVVDEVLLTLQPKLKRESCQIDVNIPHYIELDSYPGPLGQVLTNLITNSMIHGFENRDNGTIKISADVQNSQVILNFSDNGVGIPSANLSKLYDPFFTTKLGRGGSGLGMNIVYNIINGVLGGKISIASTVGSGVQVEIIIPQNAPGSLNQGVDRDE
ncbi:MAG: hypothetical protein CMF25_00350 [Kangiellaceae bacterium]|nr:hypothetical protein [Kangiellaceae bacterium]|tara:strand:- start:16507 stop:18294 length:1788 start_codon:yes stop_codon:yes gene_type:complete